MTSLVRIIDLQDDPVVGRRYLVPTVQYQWLIRGANTNWPVFPTRHEDAEHLNFPWPHYHVDPRFVSPTDWKVIEVQLGDAESAFQRYPLQRMADDARFGAGVDRQRIDLAEADTVPHPPIVWRARVCHRSDIVYMHNHATAVEQLRRTYAGQTCRTNKAGWICPHKNYPLGSHAPDPLGIITCPLHGLRIEASSGVVLAPEVRPKRERGETATSVAERYASLCRDPVTGRPVAA